MEFLEILSKKKKKNLREDAHLLGSIRRARNGVLANSLIGEDALVKERDKGSNPFLSIWS